MVKIASYNVENLFARPKAFRATDLTIAEPVLAAYGEFNALIKKPVYSEADKTTMRELLVTLDIYTRTPNGAIRRKDTFDPKWAWLRANRGKFDREPQDSTQSMEIVATGRDSWNGWVELAKEPVDDTGTRMTAKVILDLNADILAVIEAEDRPALARFNKERLDGCYEHAMLIDGNDERGIDVGILLREGFTLESIRSNVDEEDDKGPIFSRDCAQYEVRTPSGTAIHFLVNHFKSQSGGGGERRLRQATKVRAIADALIDQGKHVVVLGDLNEGPQVANGHAPNLAPLYDNGSRLVECYSLANFDVGARPGSFDSCGLRNRLDYIFLSQGLVPSFDNGGLFRKGLWGDRKTRPTDWETYPEMTRSVEQASDHSAIFVGLD